ncbi:MAG: hypothetical protein HC852_02440 [Acaryochloridaceae cyanobacterium RU_4_10]|nr:hypothetical protein [Acaryochloridaceae cyanobacterium RU_4_10]
MHSVTLRSHVGSDGILKLEVPGVRDVEVEVTVTVKLPILESRQGWQPGFFEELVGSWEGELIRPD